MTPPRDAIPPQQPGEIGSPEQDTTWPKVIGVISIVFGAGACLQGVWGFFAPRFIKMAAESMPEAQAAPLAAMQEWGTWITVSSALTILIGLVLFVAGIDLVRRRRRGIKLGRVWAVLKILFGIAGAFVGLAMQQEQFRQISQQTPAINTGVIAVVVLVVVALWTCAYPVFLLIWFSRAKVKVEYAQWS